MHIRHMFRFHAMALLAGFVGGAMGWLLLDSTVSAQPDVIEASKIVVGDDIVIENGQIIFKKTRRNDSFAALDIQGLTIRNGSGRGAQSATVRAGEISMITKYEEAPAIWKRVDFEAGAIQYYPDWREVSTSQDMEVLDMDVLFKRQRAEINALRNRRGRI